MQVTIDLDRDIVIIPDNFFKKITEENEKLLKFGATTQPAIGRIKRSFEVAMSDTDKRLLTRANAAKKTQLSKQKVTVYKDGIKDISIKNVKKSIKIRGHTLS